MKTNTMSKILGWTQVPGKGKQFLSLIRNPPCYS